MEKTEKQIRTYLIDDSKFKLVDGEVDIRKLSKANKEQLLFRQNNDMLIHLKHIAKSSAVLEYASMLLCKKYGIDLDEELKREATEFLAKQEAELKKQEEEIKKTLEKENLKNKQS